ncbi:hypothetical protein DOM21_17325 [Bacteriovorax stolpii]|uniref:Uncharacterized protein n=1 Tax=Bacteriovorax stolpii TaxID=960 RepID=A0A2K9NN04_BACTC|nr:hypothetical protein [Bacteriovorax stolpii]AUN96887.1 hypothetical protein C0V70_01950 [Bacteriovorax stolpii]QDK43184.1 hypothetical protein DOM21_17325 [Bacteriovorax stolpii]TDP53165.1 hypothetical protein C8D79_1807 [Bacteriovorax stolpii]
MTKLIKPFFLVSLLFAQASAFAAKEVVTQDFVADSLSAKEKAQIASWIANKKVESIISGTITLHPNIKVPPGGELHLRLVNFSSIYRPFIFKRFYKVQFPYKFEIKTSDFVGNIGLPALFEPYYLEAFYYRYLPNRTPRYDDFSSNLVAGGEAWGDPGRPYPLSFGQVRNFQLNFWWTPELFGSKYSAPIKDSPGLMSGWLYLSALLRKDLKDVKQVEGNIYICDKNLKLIKSAPFKISDLSAPLEWHTELATPITGFISVIGEAKKEKGESVYLYGTRANARVSVSLPVSNLKIALTTSSNTKWQPCLSENYHGK